MSLQQKVMEKIKEAMRSKDTVALESLRAIKSEILLLQTKSSDSGDLSEGDEMKIIQKLVKQRKDSAAVYTEQGREDLAAPELAQVEVISQFLPEQMSADDVAKVVNDIVATVGASSMKDMGRVMGMASKQLAGKADGKTIADLVKAALS